MNKPRERTGCMLCYPFEEKRIRYPWIAQPKLDGLRMLYVPNEGLFSSTQLKINSLPEIENHLHSLNLSETLDGEAYSHDIPFEKICSIVRKTTSLDPDRHLIQFHIFDIKNPANQDYRLLWLLENHKENPFTSLLEHQVLDSTYDLNRYLADCMLRGYEGIILRDPKGLYKETRSTQIMKLKPTQEDTYLIVDSIQEFTIHGEPKNALGAFICAAKSNLKEFFNVGTGLTREQRIQLWKVRDTLPGRTIRIKYQDLTENSIPRFPVHLEVL